MSTDRSAVALLLLASLTLAAPSAFAQDLKIIELRNRPAQELIPVIQPLLSPGDVVKGMDYRLIVRTSPARLREIERVIQELDRAPRTLTLTVREVSREEASHLTAGVAARVRAGDAKIGVGASSGPPSGASLTSRGDKHRLRIDAQQTTTRGETGSTQQLRITEGKPAFIRLGQSRVHTTGVPVVVVGKVGVATRTVTQDTGVGFSVTARTQGKQVQLNIAVENSSFSDPRLGLANVRGLRTSVTAAPGQWIDLGGLAQDEQTSSRSIGGYAQDSRREGWTVVLKVE